MPKGKTVSGFRPREYYNRVLRSGRAPRKCQGTLLAILWCAEFDRPEVTFTVQQIAEFAVCDETTAKRHIRELRKCNIITPIQNFAGGRGNAVTYRVNPQGQGGTGGGSSAGQGGAGGGSGMDEAETRRLSYLMSHAGGGHGYGEARRIIEKEREQGE